MRENLHDQLSAADISQTERQGLERTARGHVWLKYLAVEHDGQHGGRTRISFGERWLKASGRFPEMPAEAGESAGTPVRVPRKWEDS